MIPANHRWAATLSDGREKPIVAWDDNGAALVVDEKHGSLRPVKDYGNFVRIVETAPPAIAAVPGGGWQFEYAEDDGSTSRLPVIAWAVDANGWATPIAPDLNSGYGEPEDATNFVRLVPPRPDGSLEFGD